eukprot:354911-Chlamydomonas_euryale.AAC.2
MPSWCRRTGFFRPGTWRRPRYERSVCGDNAQIVRTHVCVDLGPGGDPGMSDGCVEVRFCLTGLLILNHPCRISSSCAASKAWDQNLLRACYMQRPAARGSSPTRALSLLCPSTPAGLTLAPHPSTLSRTGPGSAPQLTNPYDYVTVAVKDVASACRAALFKACEGDKQVGLPEDGGPHTSTHPHVHTSARHVNPPCTHASLPLYERCKRLMACEGEGALCAARLCSGLHLQGAMGVRVLSGRAS